VLLLLVERVSPEPLRSLVESNVGRAVEHKADNDFRRLLLALRGYACACLMGYHSWSGRAHSSSLSRRA